MTDYRGIALVGPMAAGKTTVADVLIWEFGFRRISMIGAFRDLFARAYPGIGKGDEMTVEREYFCHWVECPQAEEAHTHIRSVTVSGRQQMQDFAPATRAIDRLFWTRVAFNDAEQMLADGVPHVSDDVRYPSEAEMARERGFLIVRIETPREERLRRYEQAYGRRPTAAEENAPTEQNIDSIEADLVIDGMADPMTNAIDLADRLGLIRRIRIEKEDTTPE